MSDRAEGGAPPREGQDLKRRALSLGGANTIDYALQFLLPIVLVRCLDTEAFGQYRLLWLAAGTVMAVVTQSMAGSLYYFLPRSEPGAKRLYVNQTLLFLVAAGLIGAWAVSAWNPWLPEKMRALAAHEAIVPAFVLFWVIGSLLDLLPTVEERVLWQTRATIGLSALRAIVLSLTAFVTRDFGPVLVMTLAFVAFKVVVLLGYVIRFHGLRGPVFSARAFGEQLGQAAPFGAAGALYGLRTQADQWIAAALFSVGMFASFSIAAVLGPLLHLFRQSVIQAFLPSMSRLQAAGDVAGMLRLNARANALVGMLAFPLLACAFVYAEEIVTIVYTASYVAAASVMRVYILGLAGLVLELVTVMLLLKQGRFAMRINLFVLPLSIAISWMLANQFGLAGAAAGSVSVIYVDLAFTLRRIARCSGVPVRRMQDWSALGRAALFAVLAAALAWGITATYFSSGGPLLRVISGGAALVAAYAALHAMFGTGRGEFALVRNPERGH